VKTSSTGTERARDDMNPEFEQILKRICAYGHQEKDLQDLHNMALPQNNNKITSRIPRKTMENPGRHFWQ